jgi:hypothetical protein
VHNDHHFGKLAHMLLHNKTSRIQVHKCNVVVHRNFHSWTKTSTLRYEVLKGFRSSVESKDIDDQDELVNLMSYGLKDCPANRRVARLVRLQRIGNLQKKGVGSSWLLPDRLGSESTRFRID